MKFNLPTLIKNSWEDRNTFFLSSYLLIGLMAALSLVSLWCFSLFYQKNEELNLASTLINSLEEKALKNKWNKQKEVDYFQRLSIQGEIDIESPKNEEESAILQSLTKDPALCENMRVLTRLDKLKNNDIQFNLLEEKSLKGLKEETFKLKSPIFMDDKDLKKFLKNVELNLNGGSQKIFKEFSLKKENLTPLYQSYLVDFSFIERKKA